MEAIQCVSAIVSINGPVTLLLFFTEIKSVYMCAAQPSHLRSNTKQTVSAAGFADAFSSCTIKSSLWCTFLQETGSLWIHSISASITKARRTRFPGSLDLLSKKAAQEQPASHSGPQERQWRGHEAGASSEVWLVTVREMRSEAKIKALRNSQAGKHNPVWSQRQGNYQKTNTWVSLPALMTDKSLALQPF